MPMARCHPCTSWSRYRVLAHAPSPIPGENPNPLGLGENDALASFLPEDVAFGTCECWSRLWRGRFAGLLSCSSLTTFLNPCGYGTMRWRWPLPAWWHVAILSQSIRAQGRALGWSGNGMGVDGCALPLATGCSISVRLSGASPGVVGVLDVLAARVVSMLLFSSILYPVSPIIFLLLLSFLLFGGCVLDCCFIIWSQGGEGRWGIFFMNFRNFGKKNHIFKKWW